MEKKRIPSRMTLDRLAASMQRELLGVGRKFDRPDDRVVGVEGKIMSLDQKMDTIHVEIVDEVRKESLKVIESNDRWRRNSTVC